MADLLKFVNGALRTGTKVDVYSGRVLKIGDGNALVIESLHLKLHGKLDIIGLHFEGDIEIIMPDTSDSGRCQMTFNGRTESCPYRTDGDQLKVSFPGAEVTLVNGDKVWSWVGVSGVPTWIGVWPTDSAITEDDYVEPPTR